jgi:hypothetical protein
MRKLFIWWISSLKHVNSAVFRHEVGAVLVDASSCIAFSMFGLLLGALLSFARLPYISFFFHWFFLLPPPLVAMVASPLYVPFLVRSLYKKHKHTAAHWLYSIRWALLMYTAVGLAYVICDWIILFGSGALVIGLFSVLFVGALSMGFKFAAFPIASVAMLFSPMKKRSAQEVWRHAQRMMWCELPSIMFLWTLTIPIGLVGYWFVMFAMRNGLVTSYGAHCIIHALNILCWQLGWVVFMVFYQQRKKRYIE